MSITLPTYSRLEIPLLGRRERLWAIIATGLRQEVRRPAAIAITVLGAAFTTITSIILLFLSFLLPAGQGTGLSFFAVPASNPFVLFFVSAMAAAGVFAVNFGLTIPAGILAESIQNPSILYLSPWNDYLAIANAAFGASGAGIDWPVALAILLGVTVLAALVTYVRMKAVEVITG